MHEILKTLKKSGDLNQEKFDIYMKLKNHRNDLVHKLKSVNEEIAFDCLNECTHAIYGKIPELKNLSKQN